VEARFSTPVETGPRVHPTFYIMGNASFPVVKRSRRGFDHQTSNAEAKEIVELYLYTPSGPRRVNFTFIYFKTVL